MQHETSGPHLVLSSLRLFSCGPTAAKKGTRRELSACTATSLSGRACNGLLSSYMILSEIKVLRSVRSISTV